MNDASNKKKYVLSQYDTHALQHRVRKAVYITIAVLCCMCFVQSVEAATIGRPHNALGLVGYWDFNMGNGAAIAYDRSGKNNHGTLLNFETDADWVSGQNQHALSFGGGNEYVSTGLEGFPTGSSPRSVAVWFKTDSVTSEYLFDYGNNSSNQSFYIYLGNIGSGCQGTNSSTGGNIAFVSGTRGANTNVCGSTAINDDTWHHGVTVYNGTTISLYVDGELQSVGNPSGSENTGSGASYIGSGVSNSGYFTGEVDDVRVYNRVLSAQEIQRLYKLGTSGGVVTGSVRNIVSDGLVAHWTFDGDVTDTSTTKDITGNGSNGLFVNDPAPAWGVQNQALAFDGTNWVHMEHSNALNLTSAVSVSAWVYLDTVTNHGIFEKTVGGVVNTQYLLFIEEGLVKFRVDKGGLVTISSNASLESGQWHHLVGSWDGVTMRLYVNGVAQTETQSVSAPIDSGTGISIIGVLGGPIYGMDGKIDDVRVYDRGLEMSDVQRLYAAGSSGRSNASFTDRVTDGLLGHWTFDGDVTNTNSFGDVSGNGAAGTYGNDPMPTIGRLNQALAFDGTNDYARVGDADLPSDFTINIWLQADTFDTWQTVLFKGNTGGGGAANELSYSIKLTNLNEYRTSVCLSFSCYHSYSGEITDNDWHMLSYVRSGSTNTQWLYLDGVEVDEDTTSTTFNQNNYTAYLSHYLNSDRQYFSGKMDDLRLYGRTLSVDEIRALYTMGQ